MVFDFLCLSYGLFSSYSGTSGENVGIKSKVNVNPGLSQSVN